MAARGLSRLSRTVESGKPAVLKEGRPEVTSTSTKTVAASTPLSVAERTRASTGPVWERPPAPSMCRKRYLAVYPRGIPQKRVRHSRRGCAGVAFGRIVQAVHGAPVPAGEQVAVHRQGEAGGVVPELLLDVLEGLAPLEQEARKRVAQGVGLAVAESGPTQHRRPHVIAPGVIADRARGPRVQEHPSRGGMARHQGGLGLLKALAIREHPG